MDSKELFSGIADVYSSGRPAYSQALINTLYAEYGFSPESVIADIGSGTGIFLKQLAEKGSRVICVEPNADMRNIAKKELALFPRVRFTDGDASNSKIEDACVDFITSAQAFHWFDVEAFYTESKRILKPFGKAVLVWNIREESCQLNIDCYKLFSSYCSSFHGFGGGIRKNDERIIKYFGGKYKRLEYDNPIVFKRDEFINRCLSGSYSLKEGDREYEKYLQELNGLFDKYENGGKVTMGNRSVGYIGSIN